MYIIARTSVASILDHQQAKGLFFPIKTEVMSGFQVHILPRLPTIINLDLLGFTESTKDFTLQKPGQPLSLKYGWNEVPRALCSTNRRQATASLSIAFLFLSSLYFHGNCWGPF